MCRMMALAVLLCLSLGCQSKPNQIHFILPDGFRGAFAIIPDDPDGTVLVNENGRYDVRIPESGVLRMTGYDPFGSYLSTASFVNGDEIWISKRIDDKPGKQQIALLGGHTLVEWDKNEKPSCRFLWFVGTEEEWTACNDETRNKPGGVPKKSGK